jgi:PPOX class probable F420-dependent enzyme
MDEDGALRRVSEARVARMATVDSEGAPHVVPVVFATVGRTLYWAVDRKPKRSQMVKRLDNIRANPAVQLLIDHYDEDWGALWWIRLTGPARLVDEDGEREWAIRLLAKKYPQYRTEPPDGPIVAIDIARVVSWEGTPPAPGPTSGLG